VRRAVLTPLNSPHPSPLPVRRGEGEAAAPGAGTSLIQRQWGRGEEGRANLTEFPSPQPSPRPTGRGRSCRVWRGNFLNSTAVGSG